jgi:beta-hydroxyacyl-ACP dehydratase FabZ
MDIYSLLKIMPHRYPFLLIDRIINIDPDTNTIIGVKNVTVNEPFFMGHFPEKPVMPGVLLIEAMAQTGGLMLLNSVDASNKLLLFMGIDNAKFRKPVIPGDQLVMQVQMVGKKFNTYRFHGVATVNGQVVAEADLQAALVDRNIQL